MTFILIIFRMVVLILVVLTLTALTYLYFSREVFLAELAISFLPYICVGLIVLSLVVLVVLIYRIGKGKKGEKFNFFDRRVSLGMLLFLFFWSGFLGVKYGSEFFSFYGFYGEKWNELERAKHMSEFKDKIRVYYANILYTNYDYESLEEQIRSYDPDIVALVEFSNDHEDAMRDFFQENYPYINRNSWNSRLAGDVVFSKYPITNLLDMYPQESGKRKYSYISLDIPDERPLYFYLVHTSAPVSVYNFEMRNKQLDKISQEFWLHEQDREESPAVIMVGDFNLSPWSAFYQPFEGAFDDKLENVARGLNPTYTRSLRDQNIMVSHIDHLFASPAVSFSEFLVGDLAGSDHNPIIFDFSTVKAWKI